MEETKIREYRKGDEHKITDLFRMSSDHLRTLNYWRWANLKNPFSQSISLVVEDKSRNIIGNYSVMGFRLIYKDKFFKAGFGSQLVIHPRFRNFKLMWQLLNAVWSRSQEEGISFIFAFPNNNIWPIKNKFMDWKLVREFQSLELDVKGTGMRFEQNFEIRLQRISNLYPYRDMIERIWGNTNDRKLIHLQKNYDFVNWRFFKHPVEHYPFYLVKNQNGIIIGWIALKFYKKKEILYGHIVDFIIADEKLKKTLIMLAVEQLTISGVDIVSTWGSGSTKHIYEEIGFREQGFTTNFGIKFFDDKHEEQVDLTTYAKWDLAMSYSDAF
ncbi:MAG: GNAT family N-acetyltransferase [Candidatus Brocadiaceae bacterium]|nr:GNAT family N-acetyltransferase [Candidatus Brocadiaceae bacterium]